MLDAIYTRQSVDRIDSISVESQVEFCKKEAAETNIKVYTDRGYSGKNIDRPAFQQMMVDIAAGKIRRVIVYRLDRISRSVLDFANVIEVFQTYHVDFVSTMEKFDTGTPIGKAMLMIVMIFAQLERETIQQRVVDAYHSRSRRGLYMGGRVPYGFQLKEADIHGIRSKMYAPIPEEVEIVRLIFELYAKPQISLGDVARYLEEQNIKKRDGRSFSRGRIRDIVVNPIYARADHRLYTFYIAQGANVVNPPEDFVGTNGAYLYAGEGRGKERTSLQGQTLVLAPHEGIINTDIWLCCRKKCLGNSGTAKTIKVKETWLAGKIKCADCGRTLSAKVYHCKTKKDNRYYLCNKQRGTEECHFGSLNADLVDELVWGELQEKLRGFAVLTRGKQDKYCQQLAELEIQINSLDREIGALIDQIPKANITVMEYINSKVAYLDTKKKELYSQMRKLHKVGECEKKKLSGYLSYWESMSIVDKLTVVDSLVESIYASQEKIKIIWRV